MILDRLASYWPKALAIGSIRGRLALFLALALLPAGAIAIQTGVNTAASRSQVVSERNFRDAQALAADFSGAVSEMGDVLRVLATAQSLQPDGAECAARLSSLARQYRQLSSISLLEADGRIRCSAPEAAAPMRAAGPAFQRAVARMTLAFAYTPSPSLAREPVLGAVAPILGEGDRTLGFVGMSTPIRRLRDLIDASSLASDANVYLIDSEGALAAPVLRAGEAPPATPALLRRSIGAGETRFQYSGADGAITPLYAPDLYLVVTWRPPSASLSDRLAFAFAVASPLLMWVIAIAVGWLAIEAFVSRPLSRVEEMARAYVRGAEINPNAVVPNAPAEIRSLARTLAAMARTLRAREHRLSEALREERALLREVHHRVKNNLQVVASLLNIQARSAHDPAEAWGLARAHDRIQLLSIVHQRIYSSGEVREVRLDEIVRDIARHLISSRGDAVRDLDLQLNLGPVRCDADHAVPMGFLIGESVSNALDRAPAHGGESLVLTMSQDQDGAVRFALNGPLDRDYAGPADGGARLIEAFARQLGAEIGRYSSDRYRVWGSTPPLLRVEA